MKIDRELVDAAAKAGIAAGMQLFQRFRSGAPGPGQWLQPMSSAGSTPLDMPWEPLDNDIDACSLIVAMPLAVDFDDSTVYISTSTIATS